MQPGCVGGITRRVANLGAQMQQLQFQNEQLSAKCLELEKIAGLHERSGNGSASASANASVNGETTAMCTESPSKHADASKLGEAFGETPKGAETPPHNPLEPGHEAGHDI